MRRFTILVAALAPLTLCACTMGTTHEDVGQAMEAEGALGFDISAGNNLSCGVVSDGGVKCWGTNGSGALGAGLAFNQVELTATPYDVVTAPDGSERLTGALHVSAGFSHACAVMATGAVRCWGRDEYGELGDDANKVAKNGSVEVAGLTDAVDVAAGQDFTCARDTSGDVYCWGTNYHGELGQGPSGPPTMDHTPRPTPLLVSLPAPAVAITAGFGHACAVLDSGAVYCWGRGDSGQLGYGGLPYVSPIPRLVAQINDAVAVAAGTEHTCARLSGGTMKCWGSNTSSQLGTGQTPQQLYRSTTPVSVLTSAGGPALADVVTMSTGGNTTCAANGSGEGFCWGFNQYGQVGNGLSGNGQKESLPVAILESPGSALQGVVTVEVGAIHACARLTDGTARCWGTRNAGAVGDGSGLVTSMPFATSVVQFP